MCPPVHWYNQISLGRDPKKKDSDHSSEERTSLYSCRPSTSTDTRTEVGKSTVSTSVRVSLSLLSVFRPRIEATEVGRILVHYTRILKG